MRRHPTGCGGTRQGSGLVTFRPIDVSLLRTHTPHHVPRAHRREGDGVTRKALRARAPRTDPRAPEIRAFVVPALPQPKGYSKAYATAWGAHQDGFLTGNLPVSREDAGLETLPVDAKKRRN